MPRFPAGFVNSTRSIVYADPSCLLSCKRKSKPNQMWSRLTCSTGSVGIPTLGQLQQYEIVVPFGDTMFLDADTLADEVTTWMEAG